MFLVCILSFIWRTGATQDQVTISLSPQGALGLRVMLTAIFAIGFIYFVLIVKTFSHYGDAMDREWKQQVMRWAKEGRPQPSSPAPGAADNEPAARKAPKPSPRRTVALDISWPSSFHRLLNMSSRFSPFRTIKILDLRYVGGSGEEFPPVLLDHDILQEDWERFKRVITSYS